MAEEAIKPRQTFVPLPDTVRGYGIHIDGNDKNRLITYAAGGHVIIRSLDDPAVGDLFSEHKAAKVTVAKFSPNGEWVASGDDTGRLLVWGAKNKIIKNDVRIGRKILDIDWSSDNQRVVAAGDAAEAKGKVVGRDSANSFGELYGHGKPILSVAFKPTRPFRIATAGEDNTVCFYNGPPFSFTSSFSEHQRFVNCVRYSPDGNFFVSVGSDSKIFVFNGATGEKVKEIESKENGHKGSVFSVSFSPDSKRFLTASGDKTAKIWNLESGAVETTFTFPNDVEHMQVAALWLGASLITVSLSGAINILDADNPSQPKFVFQGHQSQLQWLAVDPKTNNLFTSDINAVVSRWNEKGVPQWFSGKGHGKTVNRIALTADLQTLVSVGYDDKIRLNAAQSERPAFSDAALASGGLPSALATSRSDADLAAVGVSQGKLLLLRKGAIVHTVALKFKPLAIDISPDNTELAVSGDDRKVHVFALKGDALEETRALADHNNQIDSVAYSPDGRYLASADQGRFIFIFDRQADFKLLNPNGWQFHTSKVTSLTWSPSGKRIATSSQDQSIIVWNDTVNFDYTRIKLEYTHAEGVLAVKFLTDDALVSIGLDRTVKLWNLPALS